MPSTAYFFLFSFLFLSAYASSDNRRILHQPFVPFNSLPPSPPPVSPPPPHAAPDYPFSPSTQNNTPFFPETPPPPPPPSPASISSIPANLSSLDVPQTSKPKTTSKLVATAVACVVAAVIVVSIAVTLHLRKLRKRSSSESKTERSVTSTPFNYGNNGSGGGGNPVIPKLRRPSQHSSEFLYLGTMVNSRGAIESHNQQYSPSSTNTSAATSRKFDSPELQPLPPLLGRNFRQNYENVEAGSVRDEDDEEFYSPRGSLGGSASRRAFAAAIEVENFRGSNYSSSSSFSSGSASPERSISLSISPQASSSPKSSRPKSPDLGAVQTSFPPPQHPPPPLPQPQILTAQSVSSRESQPPSPERDSRSSYSSPRTSHVWDHDIDSPRISSPSLDSPVRISSPVGESPVRISSPSMESPIRVITPYMESPSRIRLSSPDIDSSARTSNLAMKYPATISNTIIDSPPQNNSPVIESPLRATSPGVESPQRINDLGMESPVRSSSEAGMESPARISTQHQSVPTLAPPRPPAPPISIPSRPPPPPPPSKHWLSPRTPNPQPKKLVSEPPVLVNPLRSISIESPTLISPIQLPSHSDIDENCSAENGEAPKPKLKPLHWDKVRASSDRQMVWDQLESSSFKLNEEMIETLFVVNTPNTNPKEKVHRSTLSSPSQDNRVLDPKKSQNIAILLRALNVTTEEVCDALLEGNVDSLGTELLECLMKMAPTKEEERQLKAYKDDSPFKLGPAEKFLKAVIDIPFAFKRVDAMLYISNFESEIDYLQKSFQTLEAACEELRSSRMFLKLLEAVLKTGNRMNVGTNRGDARAFKLDTLLKLVDVKAADGKTTLLHFVVQEIIRSEGVRLSTADDDAKCRKLGLQVVSSLCSSELTNVKKAATMDAEVLHSEVLKLSKGITNISEVVRLNESSSQKFSESMNRFTKMAEEEIIKLQALESVAMSLVKEITEYFHGNSAKEEAHPFRIFMVVRDFLVILERVCKQVGTINEQTIVSSAHKFPVPVNPMQFPVPVNPMLQPLSSHGREL